MKIGDKIRFINLLFFNFIFSSFVLNNLFKKSDQLNTEKILNYILEDLVSISFPSNFRVNISFLAITLSIFITYLIKVFILNNFSTKDPLKILKNLIVLFFIFGGSLLGFLYLLRLYNLSRGLIFLYLFIYPFLSFFIIFINNLSNFNALNKTLFNKVIPLILIIFLIAFISINEFSNDEKVEYFVEVSTTIPVSVGVVEQDCKPWKGSENLSGCISGSNIKVSKSYNKKLSNLINFNNNLYVLVNSGLIINYNSGEVFLDLTNKVGVKFDESGLYSLAFEPSENYFIVSYSDFENNLIFEKYELNSNGSPIVDSATTLRKYPNSQCCHFSGNIIWSEYFDDFLISVGDMQSKEGWLHSDPLDTTSPKGKVLLLTKEISLVELMSFEKNSTKRKDILAYGLRNPWKTFEYKNFLFIPDVGNSTEEELNIVDLNQFSKSKNPFLFGWPFFEGSIDNGIEFTQLNLHKDNQSMSVVDYVRTNSILPKVYYSHKAPENFRAAIIGGGVVDDPSSRYYEHYFFADYFSNELFSYDFKKDELFIITLGNIGENITSLAINPYNQNSILLTTLTGKILDVLLP